MKHKWFAIVGRDGHPATVDEILDMRREFGWNSDIELEDPDNGGILIELPDVVEKELIEKGEIVLHTTDSRTTITIDRGEWSRLDFDRREQAQKIAIESLKAAGEPTECPRCQGKPGEPGCGKIVHAIMDSHFDEAKAKLSIKGDEQ